MVNAASACVLLILLCIAAAADEELFGPSGTKFGSKIVRCNTNIIRTIRHSERIRVKDWQTGDGLSKFDYKITTHNTSHLRNVGCCVRADRFYAMLLQF